MQKCSFDGSLLFRLFAFGNDLGRSREREMIHRTDEIGRVCIYMHVYRETGCVIYTTKQNYESWKDYGKPVILVRTRRYRARMPGYFRAGFR